MAYSNHTKYYIIVYRHSRCIMGGDILEVAIVLEFQGHFQLKAIHKNLV